MPWKSVKGCGDWENGARSFDHMYDMFCYIWGDFTVTIHNLPAGTYDFYIYGHGNNDNQNGKYSIAVGGGSATADKSTPSSGSDWKTADWQELRQYVIITATVISQRRKEPQRR